MYRIIPVLFLAVILLHSCAKTAAGDEEDVKGVWIREGTDGSGPGNSLHFSTVNGVSTLSFDCSGSPGPNWPSQAATEYKFENGQLSYLNYYDTTQGFYTVNSFNWINKGQVFEVEFNDVLLYMSAVYKVKYKKIN